MLEIARGRKRIYTERGKRKEKKIERKPEKERKPERERICVRMRETARKFAIYLRSGPPRDMIYGKKTLVHTQVHSSQNTKSLTRKTI